MAALFVGPALIFLVAPSRIVIPISFGNATQIVFPPQEYSLEIFRELFADGSWGDASWRSLRVALIATVLSLLLEDVWTFPAHSSRGMLAESCSFSKERTKELPRLWARVGGNRSA